MGPRVISQPLTALRVITQRLAATPASQLLYVVPHLANNLSACGKVFSALENQDSRKDRSEDAVLVHRYKTQISTLLLDKDPYARWAAVILIKATIEIGGWDVLHGCGSWVRGLLAILGKPDPHTTKELCIITLTRIFVLTQSYQSLLREITIPSIPAFITSCLNLLKARLSSTKGKEIISFGTLSSTVLCAFCELLPIHVTLFRPFIAQIRAIILPLIAPTPSTLEMETPTISQSNIPLTEPVSICQTSRRLFVLLNMSVPRNASADEWTKSLLIVVKALHLTANKVFRAVVEDWELTSNKTDMNAGPIQDSADIVCDLEDNGLGLPGWKGIYAGIERLDGFLHIMQEFLKNSTAQSVTFPVSEIFDVLNRILSVFPPSDEKGKDVSNPRINTEIERDERDVLWINLPNLHVSALEVLSLVSSRFGYGNAAVSHGVIEQAFWVFEIEHTNDDIRNIIYELVSKTLLSFGLSTPKFICRSLSKCISFCCDDLLPSLEQQTKSVASANAQHLSIGSMEINADSYLESIPIVVNMKPNTSAKIRMAAEVLLSSALTNLPKGFLPFALRAQMDRTAVLTRNKRGMLASIMNPPARRKGAREMASTLALLTRSFPHSLEAEAFMRPRMPVLQYPKDVALDMLSDEEDAQITRAPNDEYIKSAEDSRKGQTDQEVLPQDIETDKTNRTTETYGLAPEKITLSNPLTVALERPEIPSQTITRKHDRSPPHHTSADSLQPSHTEISQSSDTNLSSKRARFEVQYLAAQSTAKIEEPIVTDPHTLSTIQDRQSQLATADTPRDIGEEVDSDESDFEMPVIDTTMDTDEEAENEE